MVSEPDTSSSLLDNRYEILGRIGRGGMGSVYLARHLLLDELRVIKVSRPQRATGKENRLRSQREARTAIQLKHPSIAQLHDFLIEPGGAACIVMEYIDGVALDRALGACGTFPLGVAVRLARRALGALSYLHSQGFVHRDIAPDNLMLSRSFHGEPDIKVIDLGLTRELEDKSEVTGTGVFVGTLRYCAPERFGQSKLDPRSDLYSIGVILYEMLTGYSPIPGDTVREVIVGQVMNPPLDFESSDPDLRIPEGLRAILLRALAKDPADRFADAADMADALWDFEGAPDQVAKDLEQVFEQASAARPEIMAVASDQPVTDLNHLQVSDSRKLSDKDLNEMRTRRLDMTASSGMGPPKGESPLLATPPSPKRRAMAWAPVGVLVLLALWLGFRSRVGDGPALELRQEPRLGQDSEAVLSRGPGFGAPTDSEDALPAVQLASLEAPVLADEPIVVRRTRPRPQPKAPTPSATGPSSTAEGAGNLTPTDLPVAGPAEAATLEIPPRVQLTVAELRRRAEPLRLGGFDRMPTYLDTTFQPPPPKSMAAGDSQTFEFDVQLDRDGAILDIRAAEPSPDPDYESLLEDALLRTRFFPGLRNGEPTRGRFKALISVEPGRGPAS